MLDVWASRNKLVKEEQLIAGGTSMRQTAQKTNFIPRDYDVFAGLDVDKRSMSVTFTDQGTMRRAIRLPYGGSPLLSYTRKHFPGQRIAFVYEAGPTGFGLHDELTAAGHPCLVGSPSMVPSVARKRVKTNRLDANKLSEGLRGGQLRGIHVPPPIYRELRHLVQLRDSQVAQLTASKLRIKSLLTYENIPFPAANGKWSGKVLQQISELPCNGSVRFKLDQLLDNLTFHFLSAAKVQKQIRHLCNQELELRENLSFLTSLPGAGMITATHALARLGDWRQTATCAKSLGFWVWFPANTQPATR
jgi:transposase